MAIELQVSSNIVSGLDVLFVDILLVTICHLITHALFRRLKMKRLFVHYKPDRLVISSAGNISVELVGYRSMAILLVANSIFIVALALLTGFGITGLDGMQLEPAIEYLHADLSKNPLNISDLDAFVVEGHSPDRKTLWGGVFHQQNECHQFNMTHDTILRMATNITSEDSSEEIGIWPPRSTNRICLDPTLYVDAEVGKSVIPESVLFMRRRYEIDSIADCHLFYEGIDETKQLEEGKGSVITETFMQPTVLRNCVTSDLTLKSTCAKGLKTACITRFTTPEGLDLVVLATWNIDQVVTEETPDWRNMVLTDLTQSDLRPALSLSKSQQWNAAQMIAGIYVSSLTEAVVASNSALRKTQARRNAQSVAVTRLSVGLFFVPLGIIVIDISLLLLALVVVVMQLRLRGVPGKVNVASDTKELLNLLKENHSPPGIDNVKLLLRPWTGAESVQDGSEEGSEIDLSKKFRTQLGILGIDPV